MRKRSSGANGFQRESRAVESRRGVFREWTSEGGPNAGVDGGKAVFTRACRLRREAHPLPERRISQVCE